MLLWEKKDDAQTIDSAELNRIIGNCQKRIEEGKAAVEDYMRYIAYQIELSQRPNTPAS